MVPAGNKRLRCCGNDRDRGHRTSYLLCEERVVEIHRVYNCRSRRNGRGRGNGQPQHFQHQIAMTSGRNNHLHRTKHPTYHDCDNDHDLIGAETSQFRLCGCGRDRDHVRGHVDNHGPYFLLLEWQELLGPK